MNFSSLLRQLSRFTYTENGAPALNSTGDALLNMFANLAASRSRSESEVIRIFDAAWKENPLGALRCMFYIRDVRGGQGERDLFRILLKYAANKYTKAIRANLHLVAEYGRWDDMYFLVGTPLEEDMWKLVRAQLDADIELMEAGKPISLLAKWLKKANSKSKTTKALGIYTARKLGMSVYDYKRVCSRLRKYLDVVEVKMSAGEWSKIAYEAAPSRAMMIYRKAFNLRDKKRYNAFLASVEKGAAKINASTLYPYDIVEKALAGKCDRTLEAQWKALPDYLNGSDANILVMADVSGSMYGRPMASSIGLAMYFAERIRGAYSNLFMTFSAQPTMVELKGNSLAERVKFIAQADWGMNTNFMAAMRLILNIAVANQVPQSELPKALVVVTDMEFDSACASRESKKTFTAMCQRMFAEKGYVAPVLVFWNVASRNDVFHADARDRGVVLVSGQSASTFEKLIRFLINEKLQTPLDFMYDVLNGERYRAITLAAA